MPLKLKTHQELIIELIESGFKIWAPPDKFDHGAGDSQRRAFGAFHAKVKSGYLYKKEYWSQKQHDTIKLL